MSTFKTDRDLLIQGLIPDLIKTLTKLPSTDSRYGRCLEYATTKIHNQNELAVNGHEVQRRIEGMCEKFAMSNYQLYSDSLRQWKDEIANHPFITNSDQVDIHWVVIELLLSIAYNPVDYMTKRVIGNNGKLVEFPVAETEYQRRTSGELSTDPIVVVDPGQQRKTGKQSDEDDLSEWSGDSDCSTADAEDSRDQRVRQQLVLPMKVVAKYPGLKPPQKESHYVEIKDSNSEKWLTESAQNSWWCTTESQTKANSTYTSAEFAQKWNDYVDNLSLGFKSYKGLSTTSEYILLREIIWMLLNPVEKCKFFRIEDNSVKLNEKVTTTSCSLPIIQSFLATITNSMSNLLLLKRFIKSIQEPTEMNCHPVIYEDFAGCVLQHIKCMEEYVLEVEKGLMENNDFITCLKFLENLQASHFKTINALANIHQFMVFDWTEQPNYISSAHLLAKCWEFLECPLEPMENNLAISILIPCLQSFLTISDSWWSLGRLHDYSDEFLVTERGSDRDIQSHQVGEFILSCPLIKYLLDYCKESNVILNHLFTMDRINILDELNGNAASYNAFLKDFLAPFQIPPMVTEETQTESPLPVSEYYCDLMELLLLEDQCSNSAKREEDCKILSSLDIYKTFQGRQKNYSLPFQEMVLRSLRKVLMPRLDAAHKIVARIFLEEFKIAKHFRNVHWVLLLESPAMYDFYTDVFVAIEDDFNNLSSYQLTAKLESCLHTVHPQMDSMFTVDFDRHYYKTELDTILDCLEKLRIEYKFHDAEGVIDFNKTTIYNRTFSFLLQIKWALWLLENLQFGVNFARVKVFKDVNVLDFSIRRMSILRFWLLVAVKGVHSYLMNQVIENETRSFEKSLETCASIAKIQSCHEQLLKVIETKCFLSGRQSSLLAVFQEFLNFILIFRDYWHQLRDVSDQDYQLEHAESKKILLDIKIEKLEETYSNIHTCLIEKLQQEVEICNDDHLKGLLGAFVYKQPITYAKP